MCSISLVHVVVFSTAIHISWSKCCPSVCVWPLSRVAQIITSANKRLVILHAQTY